MSDLLMNVLYGHFESILKRLRKWIREKEDHDPTSEWIPLTTKDVGALGEYQKRRQQTSRFECQRIVIEMEMKNLETGVTERTVIPLNHPLVWEMSQHVNWPEHGAQSDVHVVSLLVLCRRTR